MAKFVQEAIAAGDLEKFAIADIYHAVQVVKTGAFGAFGITVKASLDGINFDTINTMNTSSDILQFVGVYRFLQITVDTLAATDSLTITYVGQ